MNTQGVVDVRVRATYGCKPGSIWAGMHWIRDAKRQQVMARDGWVCAFCHDPLLNGIKGFATINHLKPRVDGGSNHEHNLISCCRPCNMSLGNKPWRAWVNERFGMQDARRIINRVQYLRYKRLPIL